MACDELAKREFKDDKQNEPVLSRNPEVSGAVDGIFRLCSVEVVGW